MKADGSACKGWKVSGSDYCAGHSGIGIAASPEAAAAARKQSAETRKGKARAAKKRAVDVYRDVVEKEAEAFAKVRVAIAKDSTEATADRLRAMEQLEARALGRPTEHVETTVQRPKTLEDLDNLTEEEEEALIRELEGEVGLRLVSGGQEH